MPLHLQEPVPGFSFCGPVIAGVLPGTPLSTGHRIAENGPWMDLVDEHTGSHIGIIVGKPLDFGAVRSGKDRGPFHYGLVIHRAMDGDPAFPLEPGDVLVMRVTGCQPGLVGTRQVAGPFTENNEMPEFLVPGFFRDFRTGFLHQISWHGLPSF